jgi:hypothetical protein
LSFAQATAWRVAGAGSHPVQSGNDGFVATLYFIGESLFLLVGPF